MKKPTPSDATRKVLGKSYDKLRFEEDVNGCVQGSTARQYGEATYDVGYESGKIDGERAAAFVVAIGMLVVVGTGAVVKWWVDKWNDENARRNGK